MMLYVSKLICGEVGYRVTLRISRYISTRVCTFSSKMPQDSMLSHHYIIMPTGPWQTIGIAPIKSQRMSEQCDCHLGYL